MELRVIELPSRGIMDGFYAVDCGVVSVIGGFYAMCACGCEVKCVVSSSHVMIAAYTYMYMQAEWFPRVVSDQSPCQPAF